jgi:hypothetical protein
LPDIQDMKLKEMKAELESYGISTRTFLEKREFLDALKKARDEGMTPVNGSSSTSSNGQTVNNGEAGKGFKKEEAQTTTNRNDVKTNNDQKTPKGTGNRQQRLEEELEKAKNMKVGELRQRLKDMGINTKAFFEKSDFVKAYAEAIVDGVKATGSTSNGKQQAVQDEPFDPDYRDVVVQKFDKTSQQRFLLSGTIIDIDLK